MVVLPVDAEVLRQVVNTLGEKRHLDLRRTGVFLVQPVILN